MMPPFFAARLHSYACINRPGKLGKFCVRETFCFLLVSGSAENFFAFFPFESFVKILSILFSTRVSENKFFFFVFFGKKYCSSFPEGLFTKDVRAKFEFLTLSLVLESRPSPSVKSKFISVQPDSSPHKAGRALWKPMGFLFGMKGIGSPYRCFSTVRPTGIHLLACTVGKLKQKVK